MITASYYGRTESGEEVYRYTLENTLGTKAEILEYGCTLTSLFVKDKQGSARDIVLGYDTLADYEAGDVYLGAFVGRYANRIANACFTLQGEEYHLVPNDGKNHLHGAFSRKVFQGRITGDSLVLTAVSTDGEDGFPGNMHLTVTYTLTEDNALVMDYRADTDKTTIVNLTNHSYFNLDGHAAGPVLSQGLRLESRFFTESDAENLPTGVILPVENTPMDFTQEKPIGKDIACEYYQLLQAGGYDHNFILDKEPGELALAAVAKSTDGALTMQCYTTQPGVQLYTGNFLANCAVLGKGKTPYRQFAGFCLETQHYPCTPSHPAFPNVVLHPGEEHHETTVYQFT
ncbi:MAG: galactose mutarotase [Oscillospiraceae bacterium]|nr:galactose mutarotase [Oscillospiraceae bacterium]